MKWPIRVQLCKDPASFQSSSKQDRHREHCPGRQLESGRKKPLYPVAQSVGDVEKIEAKTGEGSRWHCVV